MSLVFNGIDNWVDCGAPNAINPGMGDFACFCWTKNPDLMLMTFAGGDGWVGRGNFILYTVDGVWITVRAIREIAGVIQTVTATTTGINFLDDKWHLIGFNWEFATGTLELLVDGSLRSTAQATVPWEPPIDAQTPFALGVQHYPGGDIFVTGKMDESGVLSRKLTAAEFYNLWNGGLGNRFERDAYTLGLWGLDEGVGTITYDKSGRGNDGVINGATWDADSPFAPVPPPPPGGLQIYITRPITDKKILPDSQLPNEAIGDTIDIKGCPGEYVPATFTLRAVDGDVTDLLATPSDLGFAFPASYVDIRVVKCWYQSGPESWNKGWKILTPELLLKDDKLVKVEAGENYVRFNTGEYQWISDPTITDYNMWNWRLPSADFPVQDADTLQPVDIPDGTNKQFWALVRIPQGISPGIYSGEITLSTPEGTLTTIILNVEVLPFNLAKPKTNYDLTKDFICSLYHHSIIVPDGGDLTPHHRNEAQVAAEIADLVAHGVDCPQISQMEFSDDLNLFGVALDMRRNAGMRTSPLLLHGRESNWGFGTPTDPAVLDALKAVISQIIATAEAHGFHDLYFYGVDEARGSELTAQIPTWEAIHEVGGKVFCSGYKNDNFNYVGDIQDMLICAYEPIATEAAKWHGVGHEILNYANPQSGAEWPETYRRNFGLVLYFANYDGPSDFAYYAFFGHPWNDYQHSSLRPLNFIYPTIDGVIDTWEWEGYREAITDVKYLTTLRQTIAQAKLEGKDTSSAEAYLQGLAASNLNTVDLDEVREDVTNLILDLYEAPIPPPTAAFTASPGQGLAPLTVRLTDQSIGLIDSWYWEFGDGGTSTLRNPTHIYNDPGEYIVSLTVTGTDGSSEAIASIIVTEKPPTPPISLTWLLPTAAVVGIISVAALLGRRKK